jgi:hypothetical protein
MTTEFHPSQYDALANACRAAQVQSWVCASAVSLCLGLLTVSSHPALKLMASTGMIASAVVAQPSRQTYRKLRGMVRDGEDVSAAAYQQYLWQALAPKQSIKGWVNQPESAEIPALPIDDLVSYPSVLLWGAQGSGKTSTAAYLLHRKLEAGHQIKVLDPHAEYGQWQGLEVIGAGMDYEAVDAAIAEFIHTVKERYQIRAQQITTFPALTLFCDEFTNWSARCKQSGELFKLSVSDIRKVNASVLYVSHARTLTGLGDAKGMAATRDSGLLEVFLETQVDRPSGKAIPAMKGTIKYPGQEPKPIRLEPWMKGRMDFSRDVFPASSDPIQPHELDEANTLEDMPDDCRHILQFARDKDWFTVRELKAGKRPLKGKSTEDLKCFLEVLNQSGWLDCQQVNTSTQYRLLPGLQAVVDDWG